MPMAREIYQEGLRIPPIRLYRAGELQTDVQELIVTEDMHERKMAMFRKADAFVALPGGIGTLEELVEQLTWSQLGQHKKPIILANIDGFWTPFLSLLSHMSQETFIRKGLEVSFKVVEQAKDIVPTAIAAATGRDEAAQARVSARF